MARERVLSVRVSEEFYEKLARLASQMNVTVSDVARTALFDYLLRYECQNRTKTPNEFSTSRELNATEAKGGSDGAGAR